MNAIATPGLGAHRSEFVVAVWGSEIICKTLEEAEEKAREVLESSENDPKSHMHLKKLPIYQRVLLGEYML